MAHLYLGGVRATASSMAHREVRYDQGCGSFADFVCIVPASRCCVRWVGSPISVRSFHVERPVGV